MMYSFDDGGTSAHKRQIKHASTLFLIAVAIVNIGVFGWRWITHETYEDCLKQAAKASNGVAKAYRDLKDICADRETSRRLDAMQVQEPQIQISDASSANERQEVTDPEILKHLNK